MNQNDRLLLALKKGPMDPLKALRELSCFRLAARIAELRDAGYRITKTMKRVRNKFGEECRVAEYRLS